MQSPHPATPSRLVTLEDLIGCDEHTQIALTSPRSKEVCKMHGILPRELYPRPQQSFVEFRDESPEIVERKYRHFCTRRMEKLNFLIERRNQLILSMPANVTPDQMGSISRMSHTHSASEDLIEKEAQKLDEKIQREERIAERAEAVRRQREEEQALKEMKLEMAERRFQGAILDREEARNNHLLVNAEKKQARQQKALETRAVQDNFLEEKRSFLQHKDDIAQRQLNQQIQSLDAQREHKRDLQNRRIQEAKKRREALERDRRLQFESRLNSKHNRQLEFERERLEKQAAAQQAVEQKQRIENIRASKLHESLEQKRLQGEAQELTAQQKFEEHQLMLLDKQSQFKAKHMQKEQRMDEVKSRSKAIEEAKKEVAMARLLEKEAKQNQAAELHRQQRAWEANEKRLKAVDVREAVERQKRIEAYNLELKQKQLQDKLDRMEDVEELKWRAAHERRQRLEMIRGTPGTPRMSSATSPRLGSRRSHSAGTSRA